MVGAVLDQQGHESSETPVPPGKAKVKIKVKKREDNSFWKGARVRGISAESNFGCVRANSNAAS